MSNQYVERVILENEIFAIILRATPVESKINEFISHPNDPLQVGVNDYLAGVEIKPHIHLPAQRTLVQTTEVLHLEAGSANLSLFDDCGRKIIESLIFKGDTVVLLKGGHGLSFSEDTRIIEVKQGPYLGVSRDKVYITSHGE